MECRLRDMTYSAPILVDVAYIRDRAKVIRRGIEIGRMPIMLKSSRCCLRDANNDSMALMNECPLDPGGYFIVGGTERVILIQEQLSKNRVIVEADESKGEFVASVTSSTHERKSKTYVHLKNGKIHLQHNVLVESIPIVIVMRALMGYSDAEIMQLIAGLDGAYQDDLLCNFHEARALGVYTQKQSLEYIGARVKMGGKARAAVGPRLKQSNIEEALDALANVIVAHIRVDGLDFHDKGLYIALMARRVLMAKHNAQLVDDKDFVGNKRLELAGQMLSVLFEDLFKRYLNDVRMSIDKMLKKPVRSVPVDPIQYVRNPLGAITHGLNRAIQTGNWSVGRFGMNKAGVTHVLSRLSYISALGMMTRINSQFEKSRKVSGPRALQPSQFGMICPSDTPEGEACGLMKNLAMMTHITTNIDDRGIRSLVLATGLAEEISIFTGGDIHRDGFWIVNLNGTPIAATRFPRRLAWKLRKHRRRGYMSPYVSIYKSDRFSSVNIATDEGRICRPCIIVQRGKSMLKDDHLKQLHEGELGFDDLLQQGVVEYLDVNEENDALIAMYENEITPKHTHLEIEPFTILGVVAGLIPFPHHNQSPRNTYQCAMGKQAIGAIGYNQFNRIDTVLYTLVYPQRPLVVTKSIELVRYDKLPAGQNATVVVMSFSGYDIEDALVLNKASIDRGFGRVQVFKKHTAEISKYANGRADRLGVPETEPDGSTATKHRSLDKDGLVRVGCKVVAGQTLIKKEVPLDTGTTGIGIDLGPSEYRDASTTYKTPDPSYIDKVMVAATEKDTLLVKVQTRQTRRPEIGDKFSSRHGQKGVVGIIVDQEDLPFSDSGVVPDIIMNPHGFPSRMTVGKLLECLTGKAAVIDGRRELGYGDAFCKHPVEQMSRILVEHGFSWEGKDYLTSGITGEPHEVYIFNGPIYYQRLKHMVEDKMHSRGTGPRALLTRQPVEGRARDGGLRMGEMERDALISHGVSSLLVERLMISSDRTTVDICQRCGLFGYSGYCQTCKSTQDVARIDMPYAAKLLIQELNSMNIAARLILEDEFPHRE